MEIKGHFQLNIGNTMCIFFFQNGHDMQIGKLQEIWGTKFWMMKSMLEKYNVYGFNKLSKIFSSIHKNSEHK